MVYRRSYRRTTRRGYSRRKTLSSYRIATRTSARSQAKQIYALNKRISYIQRRTKPEIKTIRRTYVIPANLNTVRGTASVINVLQETSSGADVPGPYYMIPLGEANNDSALNIINNNFARQLSYKLTGSISYADAPQPDAVPFVVRIVVVQTKATRTQSIGSDDVFTAVGNAGVFGPLQTGLARTARVIGDRRFYLSYQRPIVRISMIMKHLSSYYRDTNNLGDTTTNEVIPKGAITVIAIWNKMSASTPIDDLPEISWNMNGKLAYTDA